MLIEFRVSNFKSIKDEQVLQFTKSQGKELPNNTFLFKNEKEEFELLRSLVLYGANASGKTNVLDALYLMRQIVLNPKEIEKTVPFLLSDATSNAPTCFEVTFIANNIRYQYGFSASKQKIHTEYLYQFPNGRLQILFDRALAQNENPKSVFKFGPALKGRKSAWKDLTSETQLFLSTALQYNGIELKPIGDFFAEKLRFLGTNVSWDHSIDLLRESGEDNKKDILDFLKEADLGIEGIKIEEDTFDEKFIPIEIPKEIRARICEDLKGENIISIITQHLHENNSLVDFDLDDESLGTRRFFDLAAQWLLALKKGRILVVDELNMSLHPLLVKHLISLFHNPKININNAQLLFTTHDTALLHQDIFRRDQIWLCEKENGATKLFSLSDFNDVRKNTNFEQDYLAGRFGAIPFIAANNERD